LALRLLRTDARNRTIQRWTGLSMYRVRTLREYVADARDSSPPRRGVSPFQPAVFFRSAETKSEAAVLAGFLHVFGVMPSEQTVNAERDLPSIVRGMRLCDAYVQFAACFPATRLSIEHAMLLLIELTKNAELTLDRCHACAALILVDRLAVSEPQCAHCQTQTALHRVVVRNPPTENSEQVLGLPQSDTPRQGSLF
jgi:hypothetical protein